MTALGGIHPRVVYLSRDGDEPSISGIAPRYVRLFERSGTEFKTPLFQPTLEACEVLAGGPRSSASDVFSLCAVLVWLVAGHAPFSGEIIQEFNDIRAGRPNLDGVPETWRDLLASGLSAIPQARPQLSDLTLTLGRLVSAG
jgi:hypothetical protein